MVRNKTEKIKMASYLEAAKECLEVAIFKAASQLDLASLRDYKNYAALKILKRGPQLSEPVERAKILFKLWRKEFLTFSILFRLP